MLAVAELRISRIGRTLLMLPWCIGAFVAVLYGAAFGMLLGLVIGSIVAIALIRSGLRRTRSMKVVVDDANFSGSPAGRCVQTAFFNAVVPAFTGVPARVGKTFSIGVPFPR